MVIFEGTVSLLVQSCTRCGGNYCIIKPCRTKNSQPSSKIDTFFISSVLFPTRLRSGIDSVPPINGVKLL